MSAMFIMPPSVEVGYYLRASATTVGNIAVVTIAQLCTGRTLTLNGKNLRLVVCYFFRLTLIIGFKQSRQTQPAAQATRMKIVEQ